MNAAPLFRFEPQSSRQIAGIVRGSGAKQSISDQIRALEALERQCDDAMTRQERVSRAVFAGQTPRGVADARIGVQPHDPDGGRMTGRSFGEFLGAVELAQKCIRNALPLTTRRFIENLDRPEESEIEILEAEITRLKSEMRRLESQILHSLPQCLEDVSAKLKFVVALMLDGQQIETEYFAFLVEECAEIMDGSLGHLRVAASIPAEQPGW